MKNILCALLAVLGLSSAAIAQDGGKIPWRGRSDDPKDAMAEAKRTSRPIMLFFSSVG